MSSSIPILPTYPTLIFPRNESTKTQYVSKPFKCMTCLRCFRRMEHLNRHILTHTGERPFKCEVEGCGRCFSRHDTLLRHLKVHNKSNDKKKNQKQTKKTQKKKTKNVKRKSNSDSSEESNKKQKFGSIIISAEPEVAKKSLNDNSHNNIYNYNINTSNAIPDSSDSTSLIENKSIPKTDIKDAINIFNFNTHSSSSLLNNFNDSSLMPDSFKNENGLDYENNKNIISSVDTQNQEKFYTYDDENSTNNHIDNAGNDDNDYDVNSLRSNSTDHNNNSIDKYSNIFNEINEFGLPNFSVNHPNNSNTKLSSTSETDLNDYTMMNIHPSMSSNSSTSLSSSSINYNNLTDPSDHLLLSSTLDSPSSSLLINNSSGSLSLAMPDYSINSNSLNKNSSSFYSSITLPNNPSKDIILEKKTFLNEKSSITIPSNYKSDKLPNSINIPLESYESSYPSSSLLDIHKVKLEDNKKSTPTTANNINNYNSFIANHNDNKINMNNNYSSNEITNIDNSDGNNNSDENNSLIDSSEIQEKRKGKTPSSHILLSNENDIHKSLPLPINLETSTIPLKDLTSSIKNDELVDLQPFNISDNYLTPPLSPSMANSSLLDSQHQTLSPPKIYSCGLETPCTDNLNGNECISSIHYSNALNHYTQTVIEDKNEDSITSTSKSFSDSTYYDSSIQTMNFVSKEDHPLTTVSNIQNEEQKLQHTGDHISSDHIHLDNDSVIENSYEHGHNCNHAHNHHEEEDKKEHDYYNEHEHEHENDNNMYNHNYQVDYNYGSKFDIDKIKERDIGELKISRDINVDTTMNYGKNDVIIEVGCSNINCPNVNCPRRTFRPIASVSDGKISRTNDTDEMLNEIQCSNYNPLYHLIAAAEIVSRNNDNNSNNKNNKNNNNNDINNNNNNNNDNNNNNNNKPSANENSNFISDNIQSSTSQINSNTTGCSKCYSTDIENCHLALSSSNSERKEIDPQIRYKNYKSIKAKHGLHQHYLKGNLNHQVNTISESLTTSSSSSLNHELSNPNTNENSSSNDNNYISIPFNNDNNSISINNTASNTTNISTSSNLEKINSDNGFGGIYIRQDYNENDIANDSTTAPTYYEDTHYIKGIMHPIKLEENNEEKTVQDYEALKSPNLKPKLFKENKFSWVAPPVQNQLNPTINPFILKSNLYANVNLSAVNEDKNLSKKIIEDSIVDSCQVNITDKEQAIKQAIRCSRCPHSDRCYKRIRIEQLIN